MSVLLAIALSPLMMLALYVVGIQYERGGLWRLVTPVTVVALMLDVLLNYTLFALITWDMPRRGEATFSRRLKRLINSADWRGQFAWRMKVILDYFDPDGVHI